MNADQTKGKPKYLAPGTCPRCGSKKVLENGMHGDTGEAVGYDMRCPVCQLRYVEWHNVTYTPVCVTVDGVDYEYPPQEPVPNPSSPAEGEEVAPGRLTREQKIKYLARGGCRCPFCGSHDIQGDSFDYEGDEVSQRILCLNPKCGKSWVDVYRLMDVLDDE